MILNQIHHILLLLLIMFLENQSRLEIRSIKNFELISILKLGKDGIIDVLH
jgi:hypothetical protein